MEKEEEEEEEMTSHPEPTELTTMSHETLQLNSEVPLETTTLESIPFIAEEEQFDFGNFESTSEASDNLSDILFNKAQARPQNFKDSTDGLSVPSDMPENTEFDLPEATPTTIDKPEMMTPLTFNEPEGSTESTTGHQVIFKNCGVRV